MSSELEFRSSRYLRYIIQAVNVVIITIFIDSVTTGVRTI